MSSWQGPAIRSQPADPPTVRQGRPGLIALTVVLVNLVIIAAVGNQAVSKHLENYFEHHQTTFRGLSAASLLTFSWRFSPRSSDNHDGVHLLYSHLLTIGAFLVLSGLLTLAVTRGPVTFGRAFFGVWTAVLAAACVARAVGSLITKVPASSLDRATVAVYFSVSSTVVVIGVVLGFVAALLAAAVAAGSRRAVPVTTSASAPVAAEAPPQQAPPPFYGPQSTATDDAGRHARPADAPEVRTDTDTQALPAAQQGGDEHDRSTDEQAADEQGGNRTQRLPRFDPSGGSGWTPPEKR